MASMNILGKTTHRKVLKLDTGVTGSTIYKSNAGIFEILFFSDFTGEKPQKNGGHIGFLKILGHKIWKK